VFALREHLRGRSDLVRLRTMLKNRAHALLHRRGIHSPKADLVSVTARRWLKELEMDEAGRSLLGLSLTLIDQFNEQVKASESAPGPTGPARALVRRRNALAYHSGGGADHGVDRAGGIGRVDAVSQPGGGGQLCRARAHAARIELEAEHRAGHQARLQSFACRVYRGGLAGDYTQCKIRSQYERIKARRGAQKAIVAVSRKLLEDMYTVWTKGTVFGDSARAAG